MLKIGDSLIYIYKEESLSVCLFFMHLDMVRANALKFCTEYPFDQRKVIEQSRGHHATKHVTCHVTTNLGFVINISIFYSS